MALAESVLRKVHKLGLIPKIIRILPLLSFLLTTLSISWLLYLPLEGNYRNTYISENALMPAQVMSYFRESEWNIVRGYRQEVNNMEHSPIHEKVEFVESWLNELGLLTAHHYNENNEDTLYAIMHAPRGDDTEAMVLAVPWYTSDDEYNEGGISISLALTRYFSKMSIWSKNIILVFPMNGRNSLRSWVEAYHTSLAATAGSIEAAIVMEYGKNGDYFDYYELDYEGLNGQLPNLDLINTITTVTKGEGIKCSIQKASWDELELNSYMSRLRTFARGILSLGLAGLLKKTPGCEAFSGWSIQAVTIKAKGSKGPADVTQFGRIVDSTFRSVNNLLEKFHQSFFFYLLLSPTHFVSIGTYLPSAILVAVSFVLSSLGCILTSGINASFLKNSISLVITLFMGIGSFSLTTALLAPYLVNEGYATSELVLYLLVGGSIFLSILPLFGPFQRFRLEKQIGYLIISLYLFFISLLITTLLILHFSMALLIGYLSAPLIFIHPLLRSSEFSKQNLLKIRAKISLCLIFSNPFLALFIYSVVFDGYGKWVELMHGLITSWKELQCWTWAIVMMGWLPTWLSIAISSSFIQIAPKVGQVKKNE